MHKWWVYMYEDRWKMIDRSKRVHYQVLQNQVVVYKIRWNCVYFYHTSKCNGPNNHTSPLIFVSTVPEQDIESYKMLQIHCVITESEKIKYVLGICVNRWSSHNSMKYMYDVTIKERRTIQSFFQDGIHHMLKHSL